MDRIETDAQETGESDPIFIDLPAGRPLNQAPRWGSVSSADEDLNVDQDPGDQKPINTTLAPADNDVADERHPTLAPTQESGFSVEQALRLTLNDLSNAQSQLASLNKRLEPVDDLEEVTLRLQIGEGDDDPTLVSRKAALAGKVEQDRNLFDQLALEKAEVLHKIFILEAERAYLLIQMRKFRANQAATEPYRETSGSEVAQATAGAEFENSQAPAPLDRTNAPVAPIARHVAGNRDKIALGLGAAALFAGGLTLGLKHLKPSDVDHPTAAASDQKTPLKVVELPADGKPARAEDTIGSRMTLPDGRPLPRTNSHAPYLKVLSLPYDAADSRMADPELFAAEVNQDLVDTQSFPDAQSWREVAGVFKEGARTLKQAHKDLGTWTGFEAVLAAWGQENQRREEDGQALISSVSELLEVLDADPYLASGTALMVARHLATDPRLAKDPKATEKRLVVMGAKVDAVAKSVSVSRPKPYVYPREASEEDALNGSEVTSIHDAPDPGSPEARALAEMNSDCWTVLSGLSDQITSSREQLVKKARGATNRRRVAELCDGFSARLSALGASGVYKTAAQWESEILALKADYFAGLSRLTRVRGFYSSYLEDFTKNVVMKNLVAAMEKLPQPKGVEGVQGQTRGHALATLPDGFFRETSELSEDIRAAA